MGAREHAHSPEIFVVVIDVAILLLMVVGLRNTWDLLVTVGEVTGEDSPPT